MASNTINLRGTGQQLITTGLDGAGTGNIVVVDNSSNASVNATAPVVTNYVSSVVSDILSANIGNDVAGVSDILPPSDSGIVGQQTSGTSGTTAFLPDRKAEKSSRARAAFANVMSTSAAASANDILMGNSSQRIDEHGNLVWSRAFGGAYFQDPFGTQNGQRSYAGGAALGYEWHDASWRVGALFGLGRVRTQQSLSLDHVTTDTVFGGVYGRHTFGAFNLDATFSGGGIDATTRRYISNGAEIASGKVRGYFLAPEVALGYNIPVADGLVLTPTGRLRYTAPSWTVIRKPLHAEYHLWQEHIAVARTAGGTAPDEEHRR